MLTISRFGEALASSEVDGLSLVIDMLADLVAEAAEHSINSHNVRLAQATANLVDAMKSDGLIEDPEAQTYQLNMEILVESGALRLNPDGLAFFVVRSLRIPNRSKECRRL